MSKDGIKERISDLREILKILLLFELTILSAIVVNIYNVVIKKVPFEALFFSIIGLFIAITGFIGIWKILSKLKKLEEEL